MYAYLKSLYTQKIMDICLHYKNILKHVNTLYSSTFTYLNLFPSDQEAHIYEEQD